MTVTTTLPDSAAFQADLWSARAADWVELQEHQHGSLYHAALDALEVGPATKLLDVGCGGGTALRAAADRGADVQGLDAAEPLLAYARRRVPGARLAFGDLEALPFADGEFDVVTGFNSFQYAASVPAALAEARRVLRPGGRVAIAVWGPPEQGDPAGLLAAVGSLLPPPPPDAPGPFALSEEAALRSLLAETGFETVLVADAPTPFSYPDEQTAVRAIGSSGPCVLAARTAGDVALDEALAGALAPFRQTDGSYRLEMLFRFAVAAKPEQ